MFVTGIPIVTRYIPEILLIMFFICNACNGLNIADQSIMAISLFKQIIFGVCVQMKTKGLMPFFLLMRYAEVHQL